MLIAICGYAHPFGVGQFYGAERHLWYLMRALKDRGHECVVFTVKGCNLPGFEYVEMERPWRDDVDIYHEAIKRYEVENEREFGFIYSAQASGKISEELRRNWPYSLAPYMIFNQFRENVVFPAKAHRHYSRTIGTVINYGLPEEDYQNWSDNGGGYLVWLGRMDHGKAPDIAIDVAKRAGKRLILMGPAYHYPFCCDEVFPHVNGDKVVWLRGVDDEMKRKVLAKADAILVTLWHQYIEMFGIVNIEALACGVPVIGWNNKSIPSAIGFEGGEIIEHGKQGFIINHDGYSDTERHKSIARAVEAIANLDHINREDCRGLFESRFTAKIMAEKVEKYMGIIKDRGFVGDVSEEL